MENLIGDEIYKTKQLVADGSLAKHFMEKLMLNQAVKWAILTELKIKFVFKKNPGLIRGF